ncbi:hypothetical protein LTR56_017967 [Elasticomyces elasticus]|nr:hypothetical protein LTR56_017967 [Elasticomyces elasticus]KAK3637168.1 hypothetical protein LTR22_018358 [Elasticomyces elasticus]KAK4914241.1 hypothetical protein LTR49_017484 [Elasticomyces elasticus]
MTDQPDGMYHSRMHFRETHTEGQSLDAGTFGVVYLAEKTTNPNTAVVVKYYKPDNYREPGVLPECSLRTEIRIMKQLQQAHQHQGILQLIDSHLAGPTQWLTTPFMAGGSLQHFLETYPSDISIPFMWHVLYSVTESLLYMYFGIRSVDPMGTTTADPNWQPVIHNDGHSGNIFVGPACPPHQFSNFPAIVVADFGLSRSFPPGDFTFCYLAAEEFCKLSTAVIKSMTDVIHRGSAEQFNELNKWMRIFEGHIRQGCRELTKPQGLLKVMLELRVVAEQQRRMNTTRISLEAETDLASVPLLEPAGAVDKDY